MQNDKDKSSNQSSGSFWTTLPGILTQLAALVVAITGLVAGLNGAGLIGSKPTPSPTPPSPSPKQPLTKTENVSCGEQLSNKLGRYEGKSVITNSRTKRSGKVVIDITRETDTSCRLIARVEEFFPLAGKGTLNGQFDPSTGQKVDLLGRLSHQTEPKVWDVEMNIQFTNTNSIEGNTEWKPKSGVEDTKVYQEDFTATKPF